MNNIIISNMLEEIKQISRPNGYYWVKFPHRDRIPNWEPASWDIDIHSWMLIGSLTRWYDFQLQEIGELIRTFEVNPLKPSWAT